MIYDDGISEGNSRYNISCEKANSCWNKYKDYFNTFDIIITSDTAPISRVFLQNDYKGKILIWVCNRFDYYDRESLDCNFPDKDYYNIFRNLKYKSNVKIFGYTPFENFYTLKYKNVNIGDEVVKPIGRVKNLHLDLSVINYGDIFFIPPYHNDKILPEILNKYNIQNFRGRYNGPLDLLKYRGIIHIPYAWSNLALFENLQLGIIYFIPSINFLKKISRQIDFFWSPPYNENFLEISEWYCKENSNLFIYFDSWEDLCGKITTINYDLQREKIKLFSENHKFTTLQKWSNLLFD